MDGNGRGEARRDSLACAAGWPRRLYTPFSFLNFVFFLLFDVFVENVRYDTKGKQYFDSCSEPFLPSFGLVVAVSV